MGFILSHFSLYHIIILYYIISSLYFVFIVLLVLLWVLIPSLSLYFIVILYYIISLYFVFIVLFVLLWVLILSHFSLYYIITFCLYFIIGIIVDSYYFRQREGVVFSFLIKLVEENIHFYFYCIMSDYHYILSLLYY